MVYGGTGCFPLYISVYCRIISYWAKLLSGPENKVVYVLYKYLYNLHCDRLLTNLWLDCIQNFFSESDAPNIRHEQGYNINVKWITSVIKQTLQDQFIQRCTLCNNVQIADEFHYILECKALINIRKLSGQILHPKT